MWGPQHGLPISLARSPKHNGGQWIYTYMYHKIKPNVGKYTTIHHTIRLYTTIVMILYGICLRKEFWSEKHMEFVGILKVGMYGSSTWLFIFRCWKGESHLEMRWGRSKGCGHFWASWNLKWKIDRVSEGVLFCFFSLRIGLGPEPMVSGEWTCRVRRGVLVLKMTPLLRVQ